MKKETTTTSGNVLLIYQMSLKHLWDKWTTIAYYEVSCDKMVYLGPMWDTVLKTKNTYYIYHLIPRNPMAWGGGSFVPKMSPRHLLYQKYISWCKGKALVHIQDYFGSRWYENPCLHEKSQHRQGGITIYHITVEYNRILKGNLQTSTTLITPPETGKRNPGVTEWH